MNFFEKLAKRTKLLTASLLVCSCVSKREGFELQTNVFKAQKRILELEQRLQKEEQSIQDQNQQAFKKMASAGIRQDQFANEIRAIRGDIDTLRRGVVTGELPGHEQNPDTIAKSLNSLIERVASLEETQIEILTLLKNQKEKKSTKKSVVISDKDGVLKAFKKKQYIYIIRNYKSLLKKYAKDKSSRDVVKFHYAESLFKIGRLRDAVIAFDELIGNKGAIKDKMPFVHLRMGDSLRLLGDKKSASIYYHDLLKNFPKSKEASMAKKDSSRSKVFKFS